MSGLIPGVRNNGVILVGLASLPGSTQMLVVTSAGVIESQAISTGVTDHGALTGLSDDDHTQYYNSSRLSVVLADYATDVELASGLSGKADTSHAHGNINASGAIGSTEDLPIVTTTSGVLTAGTKTGTGSIVFATSPTLVTPNIGVATGSSLTIASGVISVTASGAAVVPMTVQGAASQTANLQEWKNSAGTVLGAATSAGTIWVGALTNAEVSSTRISWGAGGGGGGSIQNFAITCGPLSKFSFSSSNGIAAGDAAFSRISAGVVALGNGTQGNAAGSLNLTNLTASGLISTGTYTVGTLPSASANTGKFAEVTDSSVAAIGGYGIAVVAGGANRVPVRSNGTNWVIG